MENLNYKKKNIERKYFKIMRKNQSFRVRKRFYRIERYRIERQKSKNKKEIGELFFKSIILSADDIDRFEKRK